MFGATNSLNTIYIKGLKNDSEEHKDYVISKCYKVGDEVEDDAILPLDLLFILIPMLSPDHSVGEAGGWSYGLFIVAFIRFVEREKKKADV